jgi:biotin synthase-like enzyme
MIATCISCSRQYETNDAMVAAVKAGRCESLCPYCDMSHDDHSNVNEDGRDDR